MRSALFFTSLLFFVAGCPSSPGPAPVDGGGGSDAPSGLDAPSTTDGGDVADAPSTGTDAPSATDAPSTGTDAPVVSSDGGTCEQEAGNIAAIGTPCNSGGVTCPSGYVCQPFSGVVLTESCQIRCDGDPCSCPLGTSCNEHSDKGSSWFQCDVLEG
jgi:hypothetical protein